MFYEEGGETLEQVAQSGYRGPMPGNIQEPIVEVKESDEYRSFHFHLFQCKSYQDKDGVRKAKAQLELNLVRDAKNNKRGFYRYINQKRKVKESVPPLTNKNGDLVSTDEEKAEVLNNFFASVFSGNRCPHPSRVNGQHVGD
ncbi:hypothetical protein QYF61_009801 [Mycteria americana]|uniref:Uncharacterized protein n=1 Tax=Mycteria americana TaxID=33587 RepID=A0AAN7NCB9_MYCAM|nr:hypothetical protein QYF61_009801 [Mycteria americana]